MDDILSSFENFLHYLLKPVLEVIGDIKEATHFLKAVWDVKLAAEQKQPLDDRKYEVLTIVFFVAKLKESSFLANVLNYILIKTLWFKLPHAESSKSQGLSYRLPDGSFNNVDHPEIGKAGAPYLIDVPSHLKGVQPPAQDIFNKVLKREHFIPQPSGESSNIFHYATLITHDLFYTAQNDKTNRTTGYLDMAWLYGFNQEMQNSVRDKTKKRGKLYADTFADFRMNLQAPGVIALALLFNRNHNWLCDQLLIHAKEDVRFARIPDENDIEGLERLENDLFQTARNINIALYVSIIVKDYLRVFLGLSRTDSRYFIPVQQDFTQILPFLKEDIPKAAGNQTSIEFNFIYRWHSALSEGDEKWWNDILGWLTTHIPNFNPNDPRSLQMLKEQSEKRSKQSPLERPYFILDPSIQRDPVTNQFPDEVLATILRKSIEDVSGAFGGVNVPTNFGFIEGLAIQEGRDLNVCTLNEFRKFLNLKQYQKFEEINPNPKISQGLKELYGNVDMVELYPGLVAEEAMSSTESGICTGFSILFAILTDAVKLVRGDRFLTSYFNAESLTQWGLNEVKINASEKNFGVLMGDKLYNRILGDKFFPLDSIYTQFSFTIPRVTVETLNKLGLQENYLETRKSHQPQQQASHSGLPHH